MNDAILTSVNSFFMGNPDFKELISPKDQAGRYRRMERLSRSKNPCGNSGTSEPATNPVVPHFPHPPDFRGHNSEKRRNQAGTIERSPAGTDEVIFSDVTAAERGRGIWFWRLRAPEGRICHPSPWSIREEVGFCRVKNENLDLVKTKK
jgi:hypothetical protein